MQAQHDQQLRPHLAAHHQSFRNLLMSDTHESTYPIPCPFLGEGDLRSWTSVDVHGPGRRQFEPL